ncbi:hypothetical protein [Massilia genomosp. 1]|uniref:hypothetical protein n=1 Tax=Massilia genomosp. 1 TaxID=2609280 RepID=UPI0035A38B0A
MADSSFAALELLDALRHKLCIVTHLRLDAALYDPAPERAPGARGRPRRKGARQPTLKERATSEATHWRSVTLSQWYGQGDKAVEIATGTAAWYAKDSPTFSDTIAFVRPSLWPLPTQESMKKTKKNWPGTSNHSKDVNLAPLRSDCPPWPGMPGRFDVDWVASLFWTGWPHCDEYASYVRRRTDCA